MAVNDIPKNNTTKTLHNTNYLPSGGQHNITERRKTSETTSRVDFWLPPSPPHPPHHLALGTPWLGAWCGDWPRQAYLREAMSRGCQAIPRLEEVKLYWCVMLHYHPLVLVPKSYCNRQCCCSLFFLLMFAGVFYLVVRRVDWVLKWVNIKRNMVKCYYMFVTKRNKIYRRMMSKSERLFLFFIFCSSVKWMNECLMHVWLAALGSFKPANIL